MRNALVLAAAMAAAAPAAAQAEEERAVPAVTVTGEATATAAPDIALVTSGVVTNAPTAAEALKANAVSMSRVLAALKQAKVEDGDIQTSGLSVQPQYDYGDGSGQRRTPKLIGYEVRNTVVIRSHELDALGEMVDGLVAAGSNQIEGLSFDLSDRSTTLDEARRRAIADARRKAEIYAAETGAKLGAPLSVVEAGDAQPEPVRAFALRAKAADGPPTPIARGEQQMTVRVTARWALDR